MAMSRKEQDTDVIYIVPSGAAFVSPDGVGRIWFDSVAEARAETGLEIVRFLSESPEDY